MTIDPDQLLQHQIHDQVVKTLFRLLPPPLDDTPASLEARNQAAIARVSELGPVNADEIDIALHYVLSRAQATDVLAAIRDNAGNMVLVGQLMRQHALMERTAQADRRLLLQVQAMRQKREAANGADDAVWTAYATRRRLERAAEQGPAPQPAELLPQLPERLPEPAEPLPQQPELLPEWAELQTQRPERLPKWAEAPAHRAEMPHDSPDAEPVRLVEPAQPRTPPPREAAQAASTPVRPWPVPSIAGIPMSGARSGPPPCPDAGPAAAPPPESAAPLSTLAWALRGPGNDPSRDLIAEAERYARQYPRRARIIRHCGVVPAGCNFPEPDNDLMYTIITGSSPVLRRLDVRGVATR